MMAKVHRETEKFYFLVLNYKIIKITLLQHGVAALEFPFFIWLSSHLNKMFDEETDEVNTLYPQLVESGEFLNG